MKKTFGIILSFLIGVSVCAQQDPQYNLYQFNPLIINPAYAGARDGISVVANVRNQWVGIDGAPKTSVISVHGPIINKKIGAGFTLLNDRVGPRNLIGASASFAYILKLTNKYKLSFGLNAGYNRFQFNYSEITFKNSDNTNTSLNNVNAGALDLNSGLYFKSKKFFAGFSVAHISANQVFSYTLNDSTNRVGTISYRLKTHTFLTLGRSFLINNNFVFAPTIMLRTITEGSGNLDLNLNFFLYGKLWLGAFYRSDYGPGFLINYYATPKLKLGYSYDTGLGNKRQLGPSHEVCIGFDFLGKKAKIISPRFL